MRKTGLKALFTLLLAGRHARRPTNWTLSIAILSTVLTVGLVVVYFIQLNSGPH
jgi:hypothetical protein